MTTTYSDGSTATEPTLTQSQLDRKRIEHAQDVMRVASMRATKASEAAIKLRTALQTGNIRCVADELMMALDGCAAMESIFHGACDRLDDMPDYERRVANVMCRELNNDRELPLDQIDAAEDVLVKRDGQGDRLNITEDGDVFEVLFWWGFVVVVAVVMYLAVWRN